jgi:hypothetical protein
MKKKFGIQKRGTGRAVRMSSGGSTLDAEIRKIEIDLENMDPESDSYESLKSDLERLKDERGDYDNLSRQRLN